MIKYPPGIQSCLFPTYAVGREDNSHMLPGSGSAGVCSRWIAMALGNTHNGLGKQIHEMRKLLSWQMRQATVLAIQAIFPRHIPISDKWVPVSDGQKVPQKDASLAPAAVENFYEAVADVMDGAMVLADMLHESNGGITCPEEFFLRSQIRFASYTYIHLERRDEQTCPLMHNFKILLPASAVVLAIAPRLVNTVNANALGFFHPCSLRISGHQLVAMIDANGHWHPFVQIHLSSLPENTFYDGYVRVYGIPLCVDTAMVPDGIGGLCAIAHNQRSAFCPKCLPGLQSHLADRNTIFPKPHIFRIDLPSLVLARKIPKRCDLCCNTLCETDPEFWKQYDEDTQLLKLLRHLKSGYSNVVFTKKPPTTF
jgi:hypothetical protein